MSTIERRLIVEWLLADSLRMSALKAAQQVDLPQWCIAAGFIRNLVWDKLHKYTYATPLCDIDLIYYDPANFSPQKDKQIEVQLNKVCKLPWSVKNQARMHIRNKTKPYHSTIEAMQYWPELETANGVYIVESNEITFMSPFELSLLFQGSITKNRNCKDRQIFQQRIKEKKWLEIWPQLKVNEDGD